MITLTYVWFALSGFGNTGHFHNNGHKTQASLLSLEFLSKQLEAGLSPIELHFYGMICLSMWEAQTRSQHLSLYWRLILAMFCYNLHSAQPEEDWPLLIAWFLSRFLPRFWPFWEFFLATVLLHLHCLLFGVLGWVSVQYFEISADLRRAM